MLQTTRMGAVVAAAALVLGACGGGSDPGGSTAEVEAIDLARAVPLSEVVELDGVDVDPDREGADVVVAALGVEGALSGVLLALDRGYSVDQLVAEAGGLAPDGTIDGVQPSGEASGIFEETASGLVENGLVARLRTVWRIQSGPPQPVPISESLERAQARQDGGRTLVGLILFLARSGYDVEQITEAIISDDSVLSTFATGPGVDDQPLRTRVCPVLVSAGERVTPNAIEGSICRSRFEDTGLVPRSGGEETEGEPASEDSGDGGGASGDPDGTYVTDEEVPDFGSAAGFIDLVIDGGAVSVSGELTLEYAISFLNEDVVCTSTETYALGGDGTVEDDEVSIALVLTESLSTELTGSDCGDEGDLQADNVAEFLNRQPYDIVTGVVGGDELVSVQRETSDFGLSFTRAA